MFSRRGCEGESIGVRASRAPARAGLLALLALSCSAATLGACQRVAAIDWPWNATGTGTDSAEQRTTSTRAQRPANVPRAVVPGIAGEPDMRVRLREATTTLRVGVSRGQTLYVTSADGLRTPQAVKAPVTLTLDEQGWLVSDAAGFSGRFPRFNDLEIAPEQAMLPGAMAGGAQSAPDGPTVVTGGRLARDAALAGLAPKFTLDSAQFGGKLVLQARSDLTPRTFDAVEIVGIEEYLTGVVAAEMFPQWPKNAFAAQAVAARSYAIQQRALSRSTASRFDVESSVRDQAYKGLTQNVTAVQAVRETEGVVLTWNGQVLRAYYSSTAGGRPASARDTWPTSKGFEYNLAGPLQTAPRDPELGKTSPWWRWTVSRTAGDFSARIRHWGHTSGHPVKALSALTAVTPSDNNASARPSRFTIVDRSGAIFTLTAEQLRTACNAEPPGYPKVTRESRVASSDMEWSIKNDVATVTGRGFGHGVGLCQYSAKELADRAEPWQDIVTTFYPGAQLVRAY
jgi:stage II sporulation protein D